MFKEREIYFDGIGNVKIIRRRGIKRLTIRVNRDAMVSMSIPNHISIRTAERFLKEKYDWIIKTKEKIIQNKPAIKKYTFDQVIKTRFHEINILESTKETPELHFSGNDCNILIPGSLNILKDDVQEIIRKGITETLRREAKKYIIPRLNELAVHHQFEYREVRVKNLKSRWGSCSVRNNINLNIHLMRLPDPLIDYVLVHELVHTIHKNHGSSFWGTLEKHFPGARKHSRELKKYSTILG